MKTLRSSISLAAVLACSLLGASALAAPENQQSPAPGKNSGPAVVKTFDGWEVRCYSAAVQSPCDAREMLANKKTGERVMSISIAYIPSRDSHVMQIIVPLGVALQKGAILVSDSYTSPALHFRRCDRGGCYVEMLIDSTIINALSSGTSARVKIVAEGGRPFELPFPLTGFTDAHSSMVELARQKTAPAPASNQTPETPAH